MGRLARRIQNLEQLLGTRPETAFERMLRQRIKEGLERVRRYRAEHPQDYPEIEIPPPSRPPRTLTEILVEGRRRANFRNALKARTNSQADANERSETQSSGPQTPYTKTIARDERHGGLRRAFCT